MVWLICDKALNWLVTAVILFETLHIVWHGYLTCHSYCKYWKFQIPTVNLWCAWIYSTKLLTVQTNYVLYRNKLIRSLAVDTVCIQVLIALSQLSSKELKNNKQKMYWHLSIIYSIIAISLSTWALKLSYVI